MSSVSGCFLFKPDTIPRILKTYLHTRKPFYNLINMVKRVLVGYGIDVDAVSGWYAVEPYLPHHAGAIILYRDNNRNRSRINTCSGAPAGPTDVSRGVFGATVGVDRLLKMLDRYGIKATWFVPAHSVESFPGQMKKVRDAGHEM